MTNSILDRFPPDGAHTQMSLLPDALHVGFSKCASTFLQSFFQTHPDIFLVNQSHFFAPFEYSNYDSGKDAYCLLFQGAASGQVKIESDEHIVLPLFHPILDAAATTLESVTEVSRKIHDIQPDGKIIIVIRNQVDLIVSRYSEYILGGGRCDFHFFVSEFLRCSKDGINYFQNYYSKIIEIFYNDFSAINVHVFLQEELLKEETRVIEELCAFLNINALKPTKRGIRSRRVGLSDLGIRTVRSMNTAVVNQQEKSFKKTDVKIPYLLYKFGLRAIRFADYYLPESIKGNKNKILTADMVRTIRDEFGEDNRRLAKLLSRDLSPLGY